MAEPTPTTVDNPPAPAPAPSPAPASAAPPAASTVINGRKTEREISLEAELETERRTHAQTAKEKTDREKKIMELEDELHRLRAPRPAPQKKSALEEFFED